MIIDELLLDIFLITYDKCFSHACEYVTIIRLRSNEYFETMECNIQ